MEEVPRRSSLPPLAFPCFVLSSIPVEAEGLLDYQGRAGIISIVRWNLRPVIFGSERPKRRLKTILERSSQEGGRQGVLGEGQQGTHLDILLSA